MSFSTSSPAGVPTTGQSVCEYSGFCNEYEFETLSMDEDFSFWADFVQPGSRTLELGAGTGRLTTRFVESGSVVAVEPDSAMLDRLRIKLQPYGDRLEILSEKADSLSAESDAFDLVAAPRGALTYYVDPAEHVTALRECARCVHPSGRVVLDYPYSPEAATDHDYAFDYAYKRADGGMTLVYSAASFDPVWRVRTVTKVIEELDHRGAPIRKRVAQFGVRQTSLAELLLGLNAANLHVEQICGDYSRAPLSPSSPRLIAICSRKELSDA